MGAKPLQDDDVKKDMRAQVIIDAELDHSLARISPQDPRNNLRHGPKIDLSAANMLSQLHEIAGMLVQEVQTTASEPLNKRLQMAKDLAKLIPLLAVAERKVHKGWKNKDVEDMTDLELRQARKALKAVKNR